MHTPDVKLPDIPVDYFQLYEVVLSDHVVLQVHDKENETIFYGIEIKEDTEDIVTTLTIDQEIVIGDITLTSDIWEKIHAYLADERKEKKMKNIIEIKEDFEVPGTDIMLEKGDKIRVTSKLSEEFDYDKLKSTQMHIYNLWRLLDGESSLESDELVEIFGTSNKDIIYKELNKHFYVDAIVGDLSELGKSDGGNLSLIPSNFKYSTIVNDGDSVFIVASDMKDVADYIEDVC